MYAKPFICYLFWWLYSMIQCFAICKTDDWCSNSWENFNDYTSYPICFSWCFNKWHCFCGKCTVHKSFYSIWLPSYGIYVISKCILLISSKYFFLVNNHLTCLQSRLSSFFNVLTISSLFTLLSNVFTLLASWWLDF